MRKALDRLAEQILSFDEASLTSLLDEYRRRMDNFEPTREWERAVIIFFIINSMRVKNLMFNENIVKRSNPPGAEPEPPKGPKATPTGKRPPNCSLKRVK